MGFELISNVLERHFGKRGSKVIISQVLMAYGIQNSDIKVKLGVSYDALRRYKFALKSGNIDHLFVNDGNRQKSELDKYEAILMNDFDKKPPKTLRDAQERITNLTGLTRSLNRIRIYLLKKGLKTEQ